MDDTTIPETSKPSTSKSRKKTAAPLVKLDPSHPVTLNNKRIEIPEPSHEIEMLLSARTSEYVEEENDPDDVAVFEPPAPPSQSERRDQEDIEMYYGDDDDADFSLPTSQLSAQKAKTEVKRVDDDWQHDADWVIQHVENLMPPPVEANPSATMAVQRELKAMLKEQDSAKSLRELGWFMPPDLIGDNLFQWIVEMHSFDETLPIAKDLKSKFVCPMNFNFSDVIFSCLLIRTGESIPSYSKFVSLRTFRLRRRSSGS
jgi:ubiquitin-conjugating enzyme E2 Q